MRVDFVLALVRRNSPRRMTNGALDESGVNVNSVTDRNRRRLSISILTELLTRNIGLRSNSETKSIRTRTRIQSNPGKSGPH